MVSLMCVTWDAHGTFRKNDALYYRMYPHAGCPTTYVSSQVLSTFATFLSGTFYHVYVQVWGDVL